MFKNIPKPFIFLLLFLVAANILLLSYYFYSKRPPRPGSCLVLEERYCKKGKPVYKENKLVFVGFKLPKGTPIFSPFAGNFSNTPKFNLEKNGERVVYRGTSVYSTETIYALGRDRPKSKFSAIYYDTNLSEKAGTGNIEKGAVIGHVSEEKIDAFGDYNLLISFSQFSGEKKIFSTDENFLKQLFSL